MPREVTSAIIGAGRIASGYDSPGEARVLTHCHAHTTTSGLRCAGIYDVDASTAELAGTKWAIPAFASLERLMKQTPDIVVVCAPNASHESLLEELLHWSPRLVLCEKPLTLSHSTSAAASAAYARRGIPLAVNYQRRYDSAIVELRGRIADGAIGNLLGGTVFYSKGILHNGSHAVDTLRFLFGEPTGAIVTRRVADYSESDPTIAGMLCFDRGQIALVAGDERRFSLFELDLIFEGARYRFPHSGLKLERHEVADDPVFPGYRELVPVFNGESGLSRALALMTEDLLPAAGGGSPLRIAAEKILGTQYVCERLASAPPNTYIDLRKMV